MRVTVVLGRMLGADDHEVFRPQEEQWTGIADQIDLNNALPREKKM